MYIGLWQVDGDEDPVAADVLYYYDVDDAFVGGNMEFLDRRLMAVLGEGDTSMLSEFHPEGFKEALHPAKISENEVYSNYQMICQALLWE